MTQNNFEITEDLNQLLKGCHMGAATFQDYLTYAQNLTLREHLNHALDVFKKHEKALTEKINAYSQDANDSLDLMGSIGEFFEKIKTMMAEDDEKILNYSLQGLDMGLKACHDFKTRHHNMDQDLVQAIDDLEWDYKELYRSFTELKLN